MDACGLGGSGASAEARGCGLLRELEHLLPLPCLVPCQGIERDQEYMVTAPLDTRRSNASICHPDVLVFGGGFCLVSQDPLFTVRRDERID